MQRLFGRWKQHDAAQIQQLQQRLDQVVQELRHLGRQHSPEEFETSSIVTRALQRPSTAAGVQLCRLGNLMYENADAKDTVEVQKALFLWQKAIDHGSDAAKFSYAMCLKKGIGVSAPLQDKATKFFQELTATGHAWGTFAYADALSKGEGIRKNEKKAFELFKRCADHGRIPPSYMNVANMLYRGIGTDKNDSEAIVYFHKAADAGDPAAKARLGELYYHGKNGVQRNLAKAVAYYKEAALRDVVTAQFNLGYLYLTGDGVPRNALQAEALFRQAADKGFVMAMVNLAQMYRTGFDQVPQDRALAKKWLVLAAPHDLNAKELLDAMEKEEAEDNKTKD